VFLARYQIPPTKEGEPSPEDVKEIIFL